MFSVMPQWKFAGGKMSRHHQCDLCKRNFWICRVCPDCKHRNHRWKYHVDNGVDKRNGDKNHQSTPWHQYFDFGAQVISGARDTEDLNLLKAEHKKLKDNLVRKCAKKHNPHEPDPDWERIKNEINPMEAQFQMHVKTLEDKKEKEKEEEEVNNMLAVLADNPFGDPGETLGHEPARSPPLRVLQHSRSEAGEGAGGKRAADAAPDMAHEAAGEGGKWPRGSAPAAAREPADRWGRWGAPIQRLTGDASAFSAEKNVVCVFRLPGDYADENELQKVNDEVGAVRQSLLIHIEQSPEVQGIIQGTPSGLKWVEIGERPTSGEILDNQQLKGALSRKRADYIASQPSQACSSARAPGAAVAPAQDAPRDPRRPSHSLVPH